MELKVYIVGTANKLINTNSLIINNLINAY